MTKANPTVVNFKFERETKGAVRFFVTASADGVTPLTNEEGAKIGTLYLRKAALNGTVPERLQITITVA